MPNKAKKHSDQLFKQLQTISKNAHDQDTSHILSVRSQEVQNIPDSTHLVRMKKFRFQLLHQWLVHNFSPCRAADIGGGKGLLSHLLIESGWQATVIDPVPQDLPKKYKDIVLNRRVKISPDARVPNIPAPFDNRHGRHFDLLIGMHAHGCNAKIIDAAAEFGCGFVIFPCCVIDEPFYPPLGVSWLESLADYAVRAGIIPKPFRLNFKGQNIGLYAPSRRS